MQIEPGSFRDPSGRIFYSNGRVLRAIYPPGVAAFESARDSGVLRRSVESGHLLEFQEIPVQPEQTEPVPTYLLEHPRVDFISYPYEWTFSALKAAALLQLQLHLDVLADGFTLSDATAYNVQFQGTRPIFIDHLSIVPYRSEQGWAGQRQFAMQYLCPLLLWAKRGIAPNHWYRGSIEGIAPEDLAPLLRFRERLSFNVLAHVFGLALVHRQSLKRDVGTVNARSRQLSAQNLRATLKSLRDYVAGLQMRHGQTVWSDYANCNSYDDDRRAAKHAFIAKHVERWTPRRLIDVGCNSGDFSETAVAAGARSILALDFDFGALEAAFARFNSSGAPVLPLWLDATNPSPSQGWANAERSSLVERANADALLALALIHHLAIGKNVPLGMAVDWLLSLAPAGIIEFPDKNDIMVRELLRGRPDIFPDYTEEGFLAHVAERAEVVDRVRLGDRGRLLIAYQR